MLSGSEAGKLLLESIIFTIMGGFIKHWINGMEKTTENNKIELANKTDRTTRELQDAIKYNRDEYHEGINRVVDSIDKLSAHMEVANGRTGKLETRLAEQVAACRTRNSGDRSTCTDRATDRRINHGS